MLGVSDLSDLGDVSDVSDVSHPRDASDARGLARRNALLASAVQSIDDAVIMADESGAVTFLNRQAEETTGVAARDAVGLRLEVVFPVSVAFEIASDVRVTLRRRDGSTTLIEHSAAPIVVDNGDVKGTVITFRDISERLQREEERALTERLTSVATIAAGICHELNNPVASVESNLLFAARALDSVAQRSPKLGAVLADAIDAVADGAAGAARVKEIVKQMKVFLFADAGPALVDVNRAMRMAMRLLATDIAAVADLDDALGDVGPVLCDEGQLVQCFMNILKNASQAIKSTGGARAGHIRVRSSAEPPWAVLQVEDDGVGIAADDVGRIFEPFFTTREPGQGVGLGLSISRAIVLRAGGAVAATSGAGGGTILRIQLPLAAV